MESIVIIALIYALPILLKLIKKSMETDVPKNYEAEGVKKPNEVKLNRKLKYENRVTNKFEGLHLMIKKVADELAHKLSDEVSQPDVEAVMPKIELEEVRFNKRTATGNSAKTEPESDVIFLDNKYNTEKLIRHDFASKKSIRKAIIMSEVLGKPKSFKNRQN
ncbi:MAG: hypothetical protein WBH44_06905 [Proteocatella sp.]